MSVFNCGCCGVLFPDMYKHTHHKIPQGVGGPDTPDNLIDLCPGCHDALHNIAHKMLSNKYPVGKILDTIHLIYKDNQKAKKICQELATNVRNAMLKSREEGLHPDHLIAVTTSLRKRMKDLLSLRCKELKISQEDYLRGLIIQDLKPRYLLQDTPFSENKLVKALKANQSRNA